MKPFLPLFLNNSFCFMKLAAWRLLSWIRWIRKCILIMRNENLYKSKKDFRITLELIDMLHAPCWCSSLFIIVFQNSKRQSYVHLSIFMGLQVFSAFCLSSKSSLTTKSELRPKSQAHSSAFEDISLQTDISALSWSRVCSSNIEHSWWKRFGGEF